MPRQTRRAPSPMGTPTRPTTTNAITGVIPSFMLQTPPHAPFLPSPLPPSNNLPHNSAIDLAMSDTEAADDSSLFESAPHDPDDSRKLAGLRDISSLATWTLSSSKPGCGLAQLRHPSPTHFWQSDGPQPHTLTLHFFKLVAIMKIRIYLDFELDESYTPTKMRFFAGMSEGSLVEFGGWEVQETTDPESGETASGIENVRGWIDIPLQGVGGRETRHHESGSISRVRMKHQRPSSDGAPISGSQSMLEEDGEEDSTTDFTGGDVLKCMVLQVQICENHQNGKDTHVRGFEVFARDESGDSEGRRKVKKSKRQDSPGEGDEEKEVEMVGIREADWMGEPFLR